MSPFPQSVADSSAFPAVLLDRLRGLFRWPLFSSAFRSISNGHVGFVDKVSLKQVSVALSNVQKYYFVVTDQCRLISADDSSCIYSATTIATMYSRSHDNTDRQNYTFV